MAREAWYFVKPQTSIRLALVLDCSASAFPYWNEIRSTAKELLALPYLAEGSVHFLSDPCAYPPDALTRCAASNAHGTQSRASLVTPIFEGLESKPPNAVVVLGAGRLFDLEDWLDTPLLKRTLFARFGGLSLTGGLAGCEECDSSVERISQKLYKLPTRIEVFGSGFMPCFWNNREYQWDGKRLRAERAGDYAVQIGVLTPAGQCPQALATVTSGEEVTLPLETCDPWRPSDWKALPDDEAKAFVQFVKQDQYVCPLCGESHSSASLRCKKRASPRDIVSKGEFVFSSITSALTADRWGFVLLRETGGQVAYSFYPSNGLRIADNAVAIRHHGSKIEIYRIHPSDGTWQRDATSSDERVVTAEGWHAVAL